MWPPHHEYTTFFFMELSNNFDDDITTKSDAKDTSWEKEGKINWNGYKF